MEFQGRGAGHIHGVAWCDIQKVSELIKEEKKTGIILSDDGEDSDENKTEDQVSILFFCLGTSCSVPWDVDLGSCLLGRAENSKIMIFIGVLVDYGVL